MSLDLNNVSIRITLLFFSIIQTRVKADYSIRGKKQKQKSVSIMMPFILNFHV